LKKLIPVFFLLWMFSSCVTLFNGPYTELYVHARPRTTVIYKNERDAADTVVINSPDGARLYARRNGAFKLPVIIKDDTTETTIYIKPIHSWLYYANIYPFYGVGFLVDYNNPNRFTYPHHIYPCLKDKDVKGYKTMKPLKTAAWEVAFIPPIINGFVINPTKLDLRGGVFGIGAGVNYHYNDRCFFSGEIGTAVAPDRVGERLGRDTIPTLPEERLSCWYANLRHHHQLGRFDIGYGLSTGEQKGKQYYDYYRKATYQYDSVIYSYRHVNLGLSFAANFRITNSFYFGMNYQPQLFAINSSAMSFNYAHMWIFGFYWRWPVTSALSQR